MNAVFSDDSIMNRVSQMQYERFRSIVAINKSWRFFFLLLYTLVQNGRHFSFLLFGYNLQVN